MAGAPHPLAHLDLQVELRSEPLHPPVHRHMIDHDTTLSQQLLDIAIRQRNSAPRRDHGSARSARERRLRGEASYGGRAIVELRPGFRRGKLRQMPARLGPGHVAGMFDAVIVVGAPVDEAIHLMMEVRGWTSGRLSVDRFAGLSRGSACHRVVRDRQQRIARRAPATDLLQVGSTARSSRRLRIGRGRSSHRNSRRCW
jgi:hypothetical protein